MQRDLEHIAGDAFDVIVVGGGIYGAWTALDAAQRGLSVALVEQNDFCSATSANHHKIIHGGFRYLQHGDLRRMRESIRERSILLRVAPELVRPMPVIVPTGPRWCQRRPVLAAALAINEIISADRNRGLSGDQRIPAFRLLDRAQCAAMAPQLDAARGGVLFHDAQILSPERLVITILERACEAGASVANYVRATSYLHQGDRIAGVRARCVLSGNDFEVRGRTVINCVGPWSRQQLQLLPRHGREDLRTFKAAVLIARDIGIRAAIAIPGRSVYADSSEVLRKNYRNYFITPWRGLLLIGTFYSPHAGPTGDCAVHEEEINTWLGEINAACPALSLGRDDVYRAIAGLLPAGTESEDGEPQYAKRFRILDHGRDGGPRGLISIVGVKFTTARGVAERGVDLAAGMLGRKSPPCRTDGTALNPPEMASDVRLAAASLRADPAALRAVVMRAVRQEMARTLLDVVMRRTDLAGAGAPPEACLAQCAAIMSEELGWSAIRRDSELQSTRALFARKGSGKEAIEHAA